MYYSSGIDMPLVLVLSLSIVTFIFEGCCQGFVAAQSKISYGFDGPHSVFKVHYSMKAKVKPVLDETSSNISCTVNKYRRIRNK